MERFEIKTESVDSAILVFFFFFFSPAGRGMFEIENGMKRERGFKKKKKKGLTSDKYEKTRCLLYSPLSLCLRSIY